MASNIELTLIIDYCDSTKRSDSSPILDTTPPKFRIVLENSTTYAYNKRDIANFTSILLSARSNPSLYEFKKIKLENRLNEGEFFGVNNTIKNMVNIYNNIEEHIKNSSKGKI